MCKEMVLAADLGGTNLRVAAVDLQGTVLYRTKRATPRGRSADEIVRAIVESAKECQENCSDFNHSKVLAKVLGVGIPGTVDARQGIIITAPNLPELNNFKMAAALESELGIKSVLENDANAAAIGENWRGASEGFADSILMTLGTGIGGGIIINGKILRGADGTAGEIGHICVEPFGAPCPCGSRGCVEQYASASAIVRITKELKTKYPDSILKNNLKNNLNNNAQLKASQVFQAGMDGDPLAKDVFRQMGFYLGVALTNLINILNPEIIVIGGGASTGWELFAPHLQETIRQKAFGSVSQRVKLARGQLGDDAGILGAAKIAFAKIENSSSC